MAHGQSTRRRLASGGPVGLVAVELTCAAELEPTVADDGIGIGPAATRDRPGHLDLPAMRDRARIAGGSLKAGEPARRGRSGPPPTAVPDPPETGSGQDE